MAARHDRISAEFGEGRMRQVVDVLTLFELAWHDAYGDVPSEERIDEVLLLSEGEIDKLVSAALLGVTDSRDLTMAADAKLAERGPSTNEPR